MSKLKTYVNVTVSVHIFDILSMDKNPYDTIFFKLYHYRTSTDLDPALLKSTFDSVDPKWNRSKIEHKPTRFRFPMERTKNDKIGYHDKKKYGQCVKKFSTLFLYGLFVLQVFENCGCCNAYV